MEYIYIVFSAKRGEYSLNNITSIHTTPESAIAAYNKIVAWNKTTKYLHSVCVVAINTKTGIQNDFTD